jgi:hypothetical protein
MSDEEVMDIGDYRSLTSDEMRDESLPERTVLNLFKVKVGKSAQASIFICKNCRMSKTVESPLTLLVR